MHDSQPFPEILALIDFIVQCSPMSLAKHWPHFVRGIPLIVVGLLILSEPE
jgi:hypothetical protein